MTQERSAARAAYGRGDWRAARDGFAAVAAADGLGGDGLEADDAFSLAMSSWWLGDVEGSLAAAEQAYRLFLEGSRPDRAATAAIHIAVDLLLRGDEVLGAGWMQRARRLLEDRQDTAAWGYLTYLLEVEGALGGDDPDAVLAAAERVGELGRRHGDRNLQALSTLGRGRALLQQARTDEGLALLDETMVTVLTEPLDPEWAGNIYCHLLSACHELGDLRRAVAWTQATETWLRTLPAAVLFGGICRVHRSQVLQATGGWDAAEREAAQVCEDLEHIHVASAAEAHYQVGELRRLRGGFDASEVSYERARARGRDPQPGLALLHLARGRAEVAAGALAAALASVRDPMARVGLRAAQVEVALALGDDELAEAACSEVADTAARYGSSGFATTGRATRGACLLARGRAAEAVGPLRDAIRTWRELGLPYEAARVGVLLARAYVALGDTDGARRELDAADAVFTRLGARPDSEVVAALRGRPRTEDGLTPRELEVLAEVASGSTNRQIATALVISEKTVARHLSNIFVKLGCASRTAAAAYAFEQGLVTQPRG